MALSNIGVLKRLSILAVLGSLAAPLTNAVATTHETNGSYFDGVLTAMPHKNYGKKALVGEE